MEGSLFSQPNAQVLQCTVSRPLPQNWQSESQTQSQRNKRRLSLTCKANMTRFPSDNVSTEHRKKSLKELMSQSTIYRRHEARALKSMENLEDTRPKAVRVLSGLPGFRTFIPPYNPSTSPGQFPPPARDAHFSPVDIATTAIDVTTSTSSFAADDTLDRFSMPTSENSRTPDSKSSHHHKMVPPHYTILTAGALGALIESCYRSTVTKKHIGNASPFQLASMVSDRAAVTLVQDGGSGSFFRFAFAKPSSATMTGPSATLPASKAQLVSGASTASLLFGAKVLTQQYLTKGREEDLHAVSLSALASSAVAGAAVALMSLVQPSEAHFLRNPTSLSPATGIASHLMQQSMLPRHMLGATIYFSSYDLMKSFISTCTTEESTSSAGRPNAVTVAMSGAIAGALYQGALVYNTSSMVLPTTTRRLMPSMLRAAPAHALLFIAYEWVQSYNFTTNKFR
jgi:hypothetical protein